MKTKDSIEKETSGTLESNWMNKKDKAKITKSNID